MSTGHEVTTSSAARLEPGPGDVIETEDGFRFAVLENGSITDGDMEWANLDQFTAAMCNDPQGPIGWTIKQRKTVTRIAATGGDAKSGGDENIVMVCQECGYEGVLADAYVEWDFDAQDWMITNVFEKGGYCDRCEGEARYEAQVVENTTERQS